MTETSEAYGDCVRGLSVGVLLYNGLAFSESV